MTKRISTASRQALLCALPNAPHYAPLCALLCALLWALSSSMPAFGAEALRVPIPAGRVALSQGEIDQFLVAPEGQRLHFPSIDRFTGNQRSPLAFRRVSLRAQGTGSFVVDGGVRRELAPDAREFYLARNRRTGIGLAVDTATGAVRGVAVQSGERVQIGGNLVDGLEFRAIVETEEFSNRCETYPDPGRKTAAASSGSSAYPSASAALAGEALTYQAVVAVDTDTEWLAGFGDDTAEAQAWINDVFLGINVFFERDVETRLLIGDVFLRVGSDPYSEPSDRSAQLNEFGEHWRTELQGVERQFALMLSGRAISAYSYSGIAWLDAYCENGRRFGSNTYGSYSFNAVGQSRTPANTALYVGHELGHNLGSPHTHCYDPPVDQCYSGDSDCFTGDPVCPAAGRGTIMSYCHVGGNNGASCGSSLTEFHPRVQSLIEGRLADELAAGCIAPYQDASDPAPETALFESGFE